MRGQATSSSALTVASSTAAESTGTATRTQRPWLCEQRRNMCGLGWVVDLIHREEQCNTSRCDYINRCISLNENFCISIHISLNFIFKGAIVNKLSDDIKHH